MISSRARLTAKLKSKSQPARTWVAVRPVAGKQVVRRDEKSHCSTSFRLPEHRARGCFFKLFSSGLVHCIIKTLIGCPSWLELLLIIQVRIVVDQIVLRKLAFQNFINWFGPDLGTSAWAHFLVSSRPFTPKRTSSKSVSTSLLHKWFVSEGSSFRDTSPWQDEVSWTCQTCWFFSPVLFVAFWLISILMFQLTSTKDRENKTTLLQFLVEYAERDYPEVLNFSDELMHLVWFQLCSQATAIYSQ